MTAGELDHYVNVLDFTYHKYSKRTIFLIYIYNELVVIKNPVFRSHKSYWKELD